MLRGVWAWLTNRFQRGEEDEPDEDSTFVPSPLDASVRVAHGEDHSGENALKDVRERAEELEDWRHRE